MDATANSNNVGDEILNEDMNPTLPSLPGLESAYIEQASGGGGGGGDGEEC